MERQTVLFLLIFPHPSLIVISVAIVFYPVNEFQELLGAHLVLFYSFRNLNRTKSRVKIGMASVESIMDGHYHPVADLRGRDALSHELHDEGLDRMRRKQIGSQRRDADSPASPKTLPHVRRP